MRVLGINAGNGVILYPFKKYVIGNIETRSVFHTKGDKQWVLNFNGIPLIKKLGNDNELPDFKDIDIIISHPDCGHSSILAFSRAKKYGNPKDNKSITLFFKGIDFYKPKIFLMENLEKLLENYGYEDLVKMLCNYNLVFHKLSVSEFGNSQINRKRLIVIGVRKNLPKYIIKVFKNIYKVNKLSKSGDIIKGLNKENSDICNVREPLSDIITLYAGYKDVTDNIRIEWVTSRLNENRWKVNGRKFSTAPGVYKNREFDFPATVRPTNRQFNHLGLMMTPRELAVIQGIPISFSLYCDTRYLKYCINKGRVTVTKTPPMEISVWFLKQLKKVMKNINK